MYKHETFPNAPITEALIDLRVTFGSGDQSDRLARLEQLAKGLSDLFPNIEKRMEHQYAFKVEDSAGTAETHARSRQSGFVGFAEDRKKAVQLRVDGFAFSKMKPYESWSSLRDEACNLWNAYREAMNPSKVVRLAVRYINRIELPLPIAEFQDYILTGPQVADGIPQGLAEFFFRVVIPNTEDPKIQAAVTSTMEKIDKNAKVLPYIFDIDAFTPVELDPTDDAVWSTLHKLRDYKNLIFFLSMTEKAKVLFR